MNMFNRTYKKSEIIELKINGNGKETSKVI